MNHSFASSSSKMCDWSIASLYHYQQITCVVHLLRFGNGSQWHSLLLLLLLLLFTPSEFFTSVLADGFSQEFEWQQVSSSLQDSSQDSGHSWQCCRLDSLYPSANFQVFQAFYIYISFNQMLLVSKFKCCYYPFWWLVVGFYGISTFVGSG